MLFDEIFGFLERALLRMRLGSELDERGTTLPVGGTDTPPGYTSQ